ncbi:MAG: phenylalanine--tRNA ligase subunit alpha, partial [Dehalococcoidia bacterium]|nr:phenylalanine--tRNA ligase subunit alpha [Dehalococcoidia bacterium]
MTAAASLVEQLSALEERALQELNEATDTGSLEDWRVRYMGRRQGLLPRLLEQLPSVPAEDRRIAGSQGNRTRQTLESAFSERRDSLERSGTEQRLESEAVDVTLPGRPAPTGRYHPTTQIIREITSAFGSLGFQTVEGPEVEWDYYNFEALNIPADHPARDRWDTLWIDYERDDGTRPMLLRTHTSPMQIRVMEDQRPPIRVIVPGRCFRHEATDGTHESIFFQIEGLAVEEGITFSDLKGTLFAFAQ